MQGKSSQALELRIGSRIERSQQVRSDAHWHAGESGVVRQSGWEGVFLGKFPSGRDLSELHRGKLRIRQEKQQEARAEKNKGEEIEASMIVPAEEWAKTTTWN